MPNGSFDAIYELLRKPRFLRVIFKVSEEVLWGVVLACVRVSASSDAWSMIRPYPDDKDAMSARSVRVIYNFLCQYPRCGAVYPGTLITNAYIGGQKLLISEGIYQLMLNPRLSH